MRSDEHSERVLKLTVDCLDCNPANYTIWLVPNSSPPLVDTFNSGGLMRPLLVDTFNSGGLMRPLSLISGLSLAQIVLDTPKTGAGKGLGSRLMATSELYTVIV